MMLCPFCDAVMSKDGDYYICPGNGPLLNEKIRKCPFKGDRLTAEQITRIIIALIDIDGDE